MRRPLRRTRKQRSPLTETFVLSSLLARGSYHSGVPSVLGDSEGNVRSKKHFKEAHGEAFKYSALLSETRVMEKDGFETTGEKDGFLKQLESRGGTSVHALRKGRQLG
ncbi:uncharacterized protein EI97DRAFT_303070 [Westerdykella ornata]|uniref:Uncharacterized protein n=1 Tax=Westerdykella ornata TaxID=318751 RepID=A0A6A6J4Y8_WESOR|nr:uncharacterized protein EI97DRAFT_303070 [Westerdykella ornata]KAF2271247.1 hypothetical protein EI97DRAFT_303070 [Westerdykella ornata]